jgi:hypothetical protein
MESRRGDAFRFLVSSLFLNDEYPPAAVSGGRDSKER